MVFGWFKKKKEEEEPLYDPANVRVTDLVKDAFLDYDLKTWQVTEVYEYDWGDDFFTDEFQLKTADETFYLHLEVDDELECTMMRKINLFEIDEDIPQYVQQNNTAPTRITYEGETFYRESEGIGYFRNIEDDNWQELVSWSYYNKSKDKLVGIDQWGEHQFSAAAGKVVQEFEFSNIIIP